MTVSDCGGLVWKERFEWVVYVDETYCPGDFGGSAGGHRAVCCWGGDGLIARCRITARFLLLAVCRDEGGISQNGRGGDCNVHVCEMKVVRSPGFSQIPSRFKVIRAKFELKV